MIHLRTIVLTSILSLFACSSVADVKDASLNAPASDHPNIIVILTDDLGWADISLNGNGLIKTPNIDRIGREGIQLTSFYAGSNVCTPSRAALLTGRYPVRTGMQHVVYPQSTDGLPESEITIAEIVKTRDYATKMIGKWHLGHYDAFWPTNQGFDSFYGVAYSNDMKPFDLYKDKDIIQSPADQKQLTRMYSAEAEEFIAAHADQPFLLYIAESAPHAPLLVPDEVAGRSEAGLYGDVVEELDRGVGQILDAVDRAGIADNTLIIFTSDNGPWFEGDTGEFRDRKGGTYEGSYRVPMLARWPGKISPGSVSDQMTMAIDLLPTIARISGAELPDDRVIDGRDLTGLLSGVAEPIHEFLYFFNGDDIVGVRNDRFKLVLNQYYRNFYVPLEVYGATMLFDLVTDPSERFSFMREQPGVAADLLAQVNQLREEIEPMKKDAYNPFKPSNPDAPIGPQLNSDVAVGAD
jgi:arylsulfatase A